MSKITVIENGPLIVEGFKETPVIEVVGIDGKVTTAKRLAFCRCGNSIDKVYCDGSHVNSKHDEYTIQS